MPVPAGEGLFVLRFGVGIEVVRVLVRRDVVQIERVVVFRAPVLVVLVETADGALLDRLRTALVAVLVRLALVLWRGVGTEGLGAPRARAAGCPPRAAESPRTGRSAVTAGAARRPGADVPSGARTAESARTRRAGWPVFTRPGLADGQAASLEGLLVEPLNRLLGNRAIRVIHEAQAARAAGFAVDGKDDGRGRADARQVLPQVCLRRRIRQIADEQAD